MMQNISAIILTKNEEADIKDCLESLRWCDELIVIDDNSTDETVEIAKKLGAKIYIRSLDDFSAQRNFGILKANGKWILFVDADERIPGALAFEISNVIHNWTDRIENEYKGFCIPRIDILWGKKLRYGDSRINLLRLARNDVGKWDGIVHEKLKISGKVGVLKNPIIHYPHQTITKFLKEINLYTTLRAEELYSKKIKTNMLLIILFPLSKLILNYFFKKGFLDGMPGLIHALLMSFHSFLARGKLWTIWNKK